MTVIFIADADKLLPSAEDWPRVRTVQLRCACKVAEALGYGWILLSNKQALLGDRALLILSWVGRLHQQVWEEQKAWHREQEAAKKANIDSKVWL